MTRKISEVMSTKPVTLPASTSLADAAHQMREQDIGDVLVTEGGAVVGIATDRDIVVRGLAEGLDPVVVTLGQICSRDLVTMSPDQPLEEAVKLMRDRAIRRIPVMTDETPVGIVSLGDLAIEKDRKSALADISAASPNH